MTLVGKASGRACSCHRDVRIAQILFGALDSALQNVLVRGQAGRKVKKLELTATE
jgi:hypothetical protein